MGNFTTQTHERRDSNAIRRCTRPLTAPLVVLTEEDKHAFNTLSASKILPFLKANHPLLRDINIMAETLFRSDGLLRTNIVCMWANTDEEKTAIRNAYFKLFDFKGISIAESMRMLLSATRFTGESSMNYRTIESLGHEYFCQNTGSLATIDDAIIVLYALLMLEFSYNSKVRETTLPEFINLFKDVGVSNEFIKEMYDNVRRTRIFNDDLHTVPFGEYLVINISVFQDVSICFT